MSEEQIVVKEIEGMRVRSGDTIIIVTERWWSADMCERIMAAMKRAGLTAVMLPQGAKLYVKENG